jgi:MraZ protein
VSAVYQWRFFGGPVLTLDGKGRLTVPSKWRDQINEKAAGQLVLCKDPSGCLGLYPPSVFSQLADVLVALTGEDADEWRRLYLGSQNELEIDSGSRILIPPELRRWAGFEEQGKVVFMGVGAHFELWDPARSEARESQVIAKGKPEALRSLVLQ